MHETLQRLGEYLERSKSLKASVINALIYPAILVAMVIASLVLLLGYVVPQFMPLFQDMGAELPILTRVVLAVGDTLNAAWWLIVAGIIGALWLLRRQLSEPARRLRYDAFMLRRGRIGDLLAKLETARLARTLGTLVRNGVPLLAALTIARNVMGNTAMAEAVDETAKDVKTGNGLAPSLGKSKLFPRLALQMVQVGEESGELDGMLLKVADIFDLDVRNTLDRLLAAMVPLLTIVMAGVIALIVLAILLPILSMSAIVG
jgi:general secretion pathway protein F